MVECSYKVYSIVTEKYKMHCKQDKNNCYCSNEVEQDPSLISHLISTSVEEKFPCFFPCWMFVIPFMILLVPTNLSNGKGICTYTTCTKSQELLLH